MAPPPRMAPPPPPIFVPTPGIAPGAPAAAAPRSAPVAGAGTTGKSADDASPAPTPPPTGGTATRLPENASPVPRDRAPQTTGAPTGAPLRAPTGSAPGSTPGTTAGRATPAAGSVERATVLLSSASRDLSPVRNVAVVSKDGSGRAVAQVRTGEKGQFSLGPLGAGVRQVSFAAADLQRALPGSSVKKRLPRVTVSLLVPAMPGGGVRGNLVMHTYSRIDPRKDIGAKITVPRDGTGTIVDWGDGTPPVNVMREGWSVEIGTGRDTVGKVSFVPHFQKLQMIPYTEPDPCIPWWQCLPPPDPDPPQIFDPWTELPPEVDVLPPEDPVIDIVDVDPPIVDPPIVDPPIVDPPWIDEKGTFEIGPLPQGVRVIRVSLPAIVTEPPKPPVKVALLLPSEPRAAVEALNAGGRPPRVGERDRLLLVEHVYAPDTTSQSLRVTITMAKDGASALVDWGDGTPITNVRRDGKPVAAASVDREAVGRILFLGAKKKQP